MGFLFMHAGAFWGLTQKTCGSHTAHIGVRVYVQMRIWPKNKKKNKVGLPSPNIRLRPRREIKVSDNLEGNQSDHLFIPQSQQYPSPTSNTASPILRLSLRGS